MTARLPAHLEVAALIRRTQSGGGFAAVIRKGEADAGTLLLVLTENGIGTRLYERMPHPDGRRAWHCVKLLDPENPEEFAQYLERRAAQDRDLWVVELDIANAEQLIGLPADTG